MLLELIRGKYTIVSIVGMGKNAGKTVALNHIIEEAIDEDIVLGITSIGRDGEEKDIVTNTEKPMIYVEEGTIIATATEALKWGDAGVEILKVTDYTTPLGYIALCRIRESGYVQLAGPQRVDEARRISKMMLGLGVQIVLIDGAIDRSSSAAPSISQGTILATGAVLSRSMDRVIGETLHRIQLLRLPSLEELKARSAIESIMKKGLIGIVDIENNVRTLEVKTALNSGRIIGENLREGDKYVALPGSLVKKTLSDMVCVGNMYKNVELVVRDGTKVFVEAMDWLQFVRRGINVKVLNPINIIAVTLNPYSPQGYYFDPGEFRNRMKELIDDIPVFDLMLGGE